MAHVVFNIDVRLNKGKSTIAKRVSLGPLGKFRNAPTKTKENPAMEYRNIVMKIIVV